MGKHRQLIQSARVVDFKTIQFEMADSIKRLEHEHLESMIQEKNLVHVCGTVGNGKTHLVKDVLRNFESKSSERKCSISYIDLDCPIPRDAKHELILETFIKTVIRKAFGDGILRCQMSPSKLLEELLKNSQDSSDIILVLDHIDFILESHPEVITSFYDLLKLLKNFVHRIVLLSRSSFGEAQNLLHIPTFTPDQSKDFLIRYFGSELQRLEKVEQHLGVEQIAEFCAHNPLALKLVAAEINDRLKMRNYIESDYLAEKNLEKSKVVERGTDLEEIIKSALKSLSKDEEIVLEAMTMFPDDIKFQSLTTLLSIEKVRTEFPGYDGFYAELEKFTTHHSFGNATFLNYCENLLYQLMQLSVLKRVGDGCFRLEPIIKKLALSNFSQNPKTDDLRVNYVRLQLRYLLRNIPNAIFKGHSLQNSDETQIAHALNMMLRKFSKTGPYKLLNLTFVETRTLHLEFSSHSDTLLQLLDSNGFFDHPSDYMAFCSESVCTGEIFMIHP